MDTGNFTRPHIDELSLTSENEPSSGKTFYNLIPSNEPKQMYIQKTKQNKKKNRYMMNVYVCVSAPTCTYIEYLCMCLYRCCMFVNLIIEHGWRIGKYLVFHVLIHEL